MNVCTHISRCILQYTTCLMNNPDPAEAIYLSTTSPLIICHNYLTTYNRHYQFVSTYVDHLRGPGGSRLVFWNVCITVADP